MDYRQPQQPQPPQDQVPPQYRQPAPAYYQQQPGYGYPPQQPAAVNVVQNAGPHRSVSKQRKGTSHGLHLVLTIFTGGAWGICVWLPLTVWHKMGPRRKVVTRYR